MKCLHDYAMLGISLLPPKDGVFMLLQHVFIIHQSSIDNFLFFPKKRPAIKMTLRFQGHTIIIGHRELASDHFVCAHALLTKLTN